MSWTLIRYTMDWWRSRSRLCGGMHNDIRALQQNLGVSHQDFNLGVSTRRDQPKRLEDAPDCLGHTQEAHLGGAARRAHPSTLRCATKAARLGRALPPGRARPRLKARWVGSLVMRSERGGSLVGGGG
ncbi:hypothetical protein NL676_016284 [Syzygium grande]|nr:hypothetical protein NL676_016284 [Syzygium grande]